MKKILAIFILFCLICISCKNKRALPVLDQTATNTPISLISPTPTNTPTTPVITYTELISVPGGTYIQSDGYYSFSHSISAFKIGKYEITYELWYSVYQWSTANGYSFANTGREGNTGGLSGNPPTAKMHEPVTRINWRDTIIWCNAYSQMSGLTPVYFSDAGFTSPIKDSTSGAFSSTTNTAAGSFDNPFVNWNSNGYRLPTEGEWQYAASYKDGVNWTPYNYASGATANYNNAAATQLVSWTGANASGITQDVGGKTPNMLDIYDMTGNVAEWCWDWYYDPYPGSSTNFRGPANGDYRVIHGGGCGCYMLDIMLGSRSFSEPYTGTLVDTGFRIARTY